MVFEIIIKTYYSLTGKNIFEDIWFFYPAGLTEKNLTYYRNIIMHYVEYQQAIYACVWRPLPWKSMTNEHNFVTKKG